jgi:hypothetical protein
MPEMVLTLFFFETPLRNVPGTFFLGEFVLTSLVACNPDTTTILRFPFSFAYWNPTYTDTDATPFFHRILLSGLFGTRLCFEWLRNPIGKALFVIEEKPLVSVLRHEKSYQTPLLPVGLVAGSCALIRRPCSCGHKLKQFQSASTSNPRSRITRINPLRFTGKTRRVHRR